MSTLEPDNIPALRRLCHSIGFHRASTEVTDRFLKTLDGWRGIHDKEIHLEDWKECQENFLKMSQDFILHAKKIWEDNSFRDLGIQQVPDSKKTEVLMKIFHRQAIDAKGNADKAKRRIQRHEKKVSLRSGTGSVPLSPPSPSVLEVKDQQTICPIWMPNSIKLSSPLQPCTQTSYSVSAEDATQETSLILKNYDTPNNIKQQVCVNSSSKSQLKTFIPFWIITRNISFYREDYWIGGKFSTNFSEFVEDLSLMINRDDIAEVILILREFSKSFRITLPKYIKNDHWRSVQNDFGTKLKKAAEDNPDKVGYFKIMVEPVYTGSLYKSDLDY